ncbi:adenylate/guanylate cyclase domain-containing protein [Candidatus Magnetaquicoccus inordinatus]|uniref:adenylate/guanylate cyclase domain-containing protein n=1 Tax=Candidatus Magnetaquicoccus inordinatus TaxID=2496818 RepID=UPI00102C45CC|nr:adenylate/guanylate cyclase domain-containing protein [Candidatus Magnetaquicoccus inordinatus]
MSEPSLFAKEEELLAFGNRFLAEFGPDSALAGGAEGSALVDQQQLAQLYNAFTQVFDNYKKLLQQTSRLIRLSDRTQLRLDTVNKSLRESQAQLERRNQFIRSIFNRYMSDEVVESLLETPDGLQMGGDKRLVTVMMTDLRGFTAISETLPPETVVTIINHYLEQMTEIVFKYKGTISNFLGDGILILFGAPILRADDAQRAVACALEMQQVMPELNVRNQEQGFPSLQMGIGIHTGTVVAGNIGSLKRSQYTVMGRTVNLTARIESYAVGGQVLISEQTRQACQSSLRIDHTLEVMPKGIDQPIMLYQIGGIDGAYPVYLAENKATEYRELTTNIPVQVALLSGKRIDAMNYSGYLCALSLQGAKLLTDAPLSPFSNIKLALQGKKEVIPGLLAKVTGGEMEGNAPVEIVFTFVPPQAQSLFQAIREGRCNGSLWAAAEAIDASGEPEVNTEAAAPEQAAGQEARKSLRRNINKKIMLTLQMEDGSQLSVRVGDFSLDGLFLHSSWHPELRVGATGSFSLPWHGRTGEFIFSVVHIYQHGIGIRVVHDRDSYAMALLDGALGDFFLSHPESCDEVERG